MSDTILPGRIRTAVGTKSRTRQSHAQECDINFIMKKYQKTGAIEHVTTHGPQYGDIESLDYHTALNTVREADRMFADLPSSARKKFENNPRQFMEFVQDDSNLEEMETLGLLNIEASQRLEAQREAEKAAPAAPTPPAEEPATPTE